MDATHLGLHPSTHAEKETRYIQGAMHLGLHPSPHMEKETVISNTGRLIGCNSAVSYTYFHIQFVLVFIKFDFNGMVFFSLFPLKFPVCIFDTVRMILKIKMSKRVKGIHGQIKLLLLNTGFCHLIRQMKSYLKCSHGFSMKYDGPKGTNTQNLNLL